MKFLDESKSSKFMFKAKYDKILHVCMQIKAGVQRSTLEKAGYASVYHWKKYDVFQFGSSSQVVINEPGVAPDQLKRISYYERPFADLNALHKESGHGKGRNFYRVVCSKFHNLTEEHCKLFTDTCPKCIASMQKRSPLLVWKTSLLPRPKQNCWAYYCSVQLGCSNCEGGNEVSMQIRLELVFFDTYIIDFTW